MIAFRYLLLSSVLSLICFASLGRYRGDVAAADLADQTSAERPTKNALTFEADVRPLLKAHCFQCHGEEPELSGSLDVRLVRLMAAGGDSGAAIVAGDLDDSVLWQRIDSEDMPPGPKKLTAAEKATIADWIRQGAMTARPEPEDPAQVKFTPEELSHWAFQPVIAREIPTDIDGVAAAGRSGAIDAFVRSQLLPVGLDLSPPADRRTLIRRLTFGLHGLPPTPAAVHDFENDHAPGAYERLVDRLLGSPQYGVRWGRHWLDIAGYAESDGNVGKDRPRPHAWHYRDYVVDAMNRDLPYDRFLLEQLAGDELIGGQPDPNNPEHVRLLAATGLLRMAPDITETDNSLMDRNQAVADVVQVVSSAVLGVTVGCAQCHDHRYDPISIEDYYSFRAIFDPIFPIHQWKKPGQRLVDMTDDETRSASAVIEAKAVELQEDINARRRAHCQTIQDREIAAAPEEYRDALRTAVLLKPAERTAEQTALLERFPKVRSVEWIIGQLVEYDNPAHRAFQEEEKGVAEIRKTKPLDRLIMAVDESRDRLPPSRVFFRGNPESPTEEVLPGELTALVSTRSHVQIAAVDESVGPTSGRRLAYARQLTDGTHPLVARVIVNRVWLHHFGRGLVDSPGDFGLNGESPSHPELLDWLADDFVRGGWSLKRLHRQILLSETFRQSAVRHVAGGDSGQTAAELDPENRLLSRMNLRRLDAESLRDAILAVSGQLNQALGGPSVPVTEDAEGKAVIGRRQLRDGLFAGIEDVGGEAYRRSVFISSPRGLPLNVLQTFDLPAMTPNCQQRDSSTVTPQALWFMNDESLVTSSRQMADSIAAETDQLADQIRQLYLRAFAAEPTDEELDDCLSFINGQSEIFRAATDPSSESGDTPAVTPERQALASLCQMVLSSNRFLYIP